MGYGINNSRLLIFKLIFIREIVSSKEVNNITRINKKKKKKKDIENHLLRLLL